MSAPDKLLPNSRLQMLKALLAKSPQSLVHQCRLSLQEKRD